MAGQIDRVPAHVRVVYRAPWTEDDASRLIVGPMEDEMFKACEAVAERYRTAGVEVSVV